MTEQVNFTYRKRRGLKNPIFEYGFGGREKIIVGWSLRSGSDAIQTTLYQYFHKNA
jgi:hypothetical protein